MKRDLADMWNLVWELALLVCAGFALLNVFAPPQDLPWKPLDLNRPVGAATAAKVSAFDVSAAATPQAAERATDACIQALEDAGVQVTRAEDRDDGGFCVVRGAVRITGGAVTPLAPGGVIMQCPLAVRYVVWDRQVLRPAARGLRLGPRAGRELRDLFLPTHLRLAGRGRTPQRTRPRQRPGCRRRHAEERPHRQRASGLERPGAAGQPGSRFLHGVRDGACRLFSTVLSPDYNAAHANHLHIEGGSGASVVNLHCAQCESHSLLTVWKSRVTTSAQSGFRVGSTPAFRSFA